MRRNCHWATNEISRTASLLKLAINKNQFHLQLVSRAIVKLLANQIAAHLQDWEATLLHFLSSPSQWAACSLQEAHPVFVWVLQSGSLISAQERDKHQADTRALREKAAAGNWTSSFWQGRYLLCPMELQPKKERLQYFYFLFFKQLILPYADSQSLLKLQGKFSDKCCHSHPDFDHFQGDSGTGLHKKSDFMTSRWLNLLDIWHNQEQPSFTEYPSHRFHFNKRDLRSKPQWGILYYFCTGCLKAQNFQLLRIELRW